MRAENFRSQMEAKQNAYKRDVLKLEACGKWRGKCYHHILPEEKWQYNLFEGSREQVINYFAENHIAWHQQKHNLLSSQVLCINLFFPLRRYLDVLKPLLSAHFDDVKRILDIDFEYTGPCQKDYFHEGGVRGQNRTSSDVAIIWENKDYNKNVLLLEFKFAEPGFGECSRQGNPNQRRCQSVKSVIKAPDKECWRAIRGRKYWQTILSDTSPFRRDMLTTERYCPFRYDFYQLMRNQLLAHCIETDSQLGFRRADFGVIYHADNEDLLRMARPFGGERNPLKAWPKLLKDDSRFRFHTFTIQELVSVVNGALPEGLNVWRAYLKQRYGL
ncbi:hypothetical protein ACFLWY_05095 [Chloroflexota bacterium]